MEPTLIQILLIEDNPIESRLIRGLLADQTEARFSLECADRLSTGLERLAAGGIELVLSDLTLPDSEGLQTFLRLRRAAVGVPIVVLTGLDDQVLALTAVQEGAEDFLIKGQVDGQSLSRSLRFAVERHRRFQAEDMLHTANNEFRAARAIQQKLFPTVPELSSFDIGGMSYCAVGTCGDYFDYIRMPDDGVGIVVADVSGHGLGPSLLMASCRAYLRALARADGDIGEIVTTANRILVDDTKAENFITLILAHLNPHTRSFVYVNAGHPNCYVLDTAGVVKSRLASSNVPLGVLPDAQFHSSSVVTLEPGDIIVLLSDGVLEARSPDGSMFGADRALDVIRVYLDETALQIVDNLYYAVRLFSQAAPQEDDITAVIVKVGTATSA